MATPTHDDILHTTIGENVRVQDLINAYQNVLDGFTAEEIKSFTGLSDFDVERIIEIRSATAKDWRFTKAH